MLRRDGNVIGNPIPTNTSSATGVFRIASGQQKQILAKFPEHVELPEKPSFVTCLRGRTPAYPDTATNTASPAGRYPNSALETGQILIRIASPQDWEDRSSCEFNRQIVKDEIFNNLGTNKVVLCETNESHIKTDSEYMYFGRGSRLR